jgi:hypothetical protein
VSRIKHKFSTWIIQRKEGTARLKGMATFAAQMDIQCVITLQKSLRNLRRHTLLGLLAYFIHETSVLATFGDLGCSKRR